VNPNFIVINFYMMIALPVFTMAIMIYVDNLLLAGIVVGELT